MSDPERIWLQGDDGSEYGRTWCSDQIEDDDTEYVRADLYARLQAIVDKLPKTADGVAIVPGMELYWPRQQRTAKATLRGSYQEYAIHAAEWGKNVRGDECYSTRKAAEAARDKT